MVLAVLLRSLCSLNAGSPHKALLTETKVEGTTSQSKGGTSVELRNSGFQITRPRTGGYAPIQGGRTPMNGRYSPQRILPKEHLCPVNITTQTLCYYFYDPTVYRDTSLIRKRTTLGPYSRPMPRVVGGSYGVGRFLMGETPRC